MKLTIEDDEEIDIIELPKMASFDFRTLRGPIPDIAYRLGLIKDEDGANPEQAEAYEWTYLRAILEKPGMPLYMLPPELYVEEPTGLQW